MIVLLMITQILWPIALGVYVIRALLRLRKGESVDNEPHWYLWPFSTAEDAVGQLLLVLGVALAGIAVELTLRHFGVLGHSNWVLLGTAVAAVAIAWWQRAPLVVLASVVLSYVWWGYSTYHWVGTGSGTAAVLAMGIGVVALALLAIGVARVLDMSPRDRRLGFFAWLPATFTVLLALFVLSSQAGLLALSRGSLAAPFGSGWKMAVALGVLFAAAAAMLGYAAWRKAASIAESAVLGVILLTMLALAVWPPTGAATGGNSFGDLLFGGSTATLTPAGTIWAGVFNALLLLVLLGLVFLGYQRREDWLVTFGALLLFVFVLFKYFDWLFSLLDRSIAFVGAGLLFLVVGWLMERGRRSILKAMEAEHESA